MMNHSETIAGRHYFSIGDVAAISQVPQHTLRYWERVFHQLRPKRRGNRRYYCQREVLLVMQIRELIFEQGYTTRGAQICLGSNAYNVEIPDSFKAVFQRQQ